MKSPIFFSKGRAVRFWIQIVLVLALVRIALVPSALYANPTGEQVVGGAAGFNRPDAATLIVNQGTDRAVINWNSFSIANGELAKFVQPSSSSAVLNRVVTANPSAIYGTLQANGNVYLINPGGVLVGAGGVVNTASFVASTHDINTDEFMKGGQLNFKGNSEASVVNQGNITAREGDVFLIAKEVKNEGQLMAKDGTVGMVSGTEVSLQAVGQGNYKVRLMAAETDPTTPRTSQGEGGASKGSAEIVNEGVIQAANAVLEAKGSYLPMAIKNTGVIEATGLVENGDGSVTLTGGEGDILNTGVVAALQRSLDGQRETGGSIMMTAKNVTSDLGSVITAAGRDGGGVVKLRSADTTILRGSIEVVGASESAKGGKVQLLGENVGMFESAKVDASGGAGGGEVLVGGDYLGKNPNVPNAKAVVMGSEAKILADATINGDGGKVILWSDEYTGFYGDISARGGAFGGDGGFVETSSKTNLQAFGFVATPSINGQGGTWLIDPIDLEIVTGGGNVNGSYASGTFTPTAVPAAGNAQVGVTQINSSLNNGSNVTLLTGVSAGLSPNNSGNITMSAAVSKTSGTDSTLTMTAAGSINISQNITSSSGGLSLVLGAQNGVTIGANIATLGGNLTIQGAAIDGASLATSTTSVAISSGTVSTLGGNLNIVATGAINQSGGTLSIGGTSSITAGGNISLAQASNNFGTVVINSGTTVTLVDAGTINMGAITTSGNFTLTSGGTTNLNGTAAVGGSYTAAITGAANINAAIVAVGSVAITSTGALSVNAGVTSSAGSVTLNGGSGTDINIDNPITGGNGGTINLFTPDGSITINASISASSGILSTVNLTTGVVGVSDGSFINQTGGTITATTLNATTFSDVAGAYIYLGSSNDLDNISLRALDRAGTANQDALIYYNDSDGFNINGNGIRTLNNITLKGLGDITQTAGVTIEALGLGIVTTGNVTLATALGNDVTDLAVDLRATNPGDLSFTDADGFNVAFVDTDFPNIDQTDTRTIGIRGNDIVLTALDGISEAEGRFGIALSNAGGIGPDFQYTLLNGLDSTVASTDLAPGHIESSGTVTITVQDPTTAAGLANTRFTLEEGIHLFAGMNETFAAFDNEVIGLHGIVTITANNMVIGIDTDPSLTMHGLIMTQDINQAGAINSQSGVFLSSYGTSAGGATPNRLRAAQIVSPKADYTVTPDPGFLQLSNAELNRINTSRFQIRSAFVDASTPAVDVRSALSMNGLYDVTTVSGIFPNTPGVNRLELWASGGTIGGNTSNIQVSGDTSSDANSSAMQMWLAATAANNLTGGTVNVNAGLRSYGGYIALQGDSVNVNALVNANNPNNSDALGLVAFVQGHDFQDIDLGTKTVGKLSILRDEIALITAGTVQIGTSRQPPRVLRAQGLSGTGLAGREAVWTSGNPGNLTGVGSGTLEITDLIADLSINTLALFADGTLPDGLTSASVAMFQANNSSAIQVAGLFIGGAPGTPTGAAPGTEYILGSTLNQFDRLGVALTTSFLQDPTEAGAPTGNLLIVNSQGFVGGNSGEVVRTGQQWNQGLIRANVLTAPLYTGLGLIVAEALSITAAGPVSIYETLPTGVTGVGQYMAHISANPNDAEQMDSTEVGNEIGALGGSGTTVGLAVDATQNTPGSSGANNVWAAAARGLAISDLSGAISGAVDGILTNGGNVTLEGNAIEIAPGVVRTTGGTITIDTTGDGIAPSGGRVVIRPATGQNGFQDRLGSGALDPNLQNSILAGAPVEMNLGTTSAVAGTTFLNASLGTIWIGAPSISATAIRASAIEIGQNSIAGTAAGKITVSDALAFNSLTQSLNLSSGGAVETADNLAGADTITLAGGLAVQSIGAVALRGDVDLFAVDTSGGTRSVRFIDSDEITIGNVDGVSGILAGSLALYTQGAIAQASGVTIQATSVGLRSTADGIRLDQANDVSLLAAVATGAGNNVYFNTGSNLAVSQVVGVDFLGAPFTVSGISGANITLVTGGNITQNGNAPVAATGAFLATVAEGSSVSLASSLNNFAQAPLIAALTSTGGLGLAGDVTIVNSGGGGIILGQAGILTVELLSAGSGYTSQPTVGFSVGGVATAGTAAAILGLGTITVSSGGAGYLSSPVVTIAGGGGVGATASAVVDSNPLSTTYGQVTGITVTNPGTGYTTLPTVTLAGGSPAQAATITDGTAASLLLQRINVSNSGIAQSYTANPAVTLSGGGATSQGTATATVGGVAGYLPSSSTSILGGITGNLRVINSGGGNFTDGTGFSVDGTSTFGSTGAITLDSSANYMLGTITVGSDSSVTINNSTSSILGNFTGVDNTTGVPNGTALFGPLTLGSMGSIYQGTSGGFLSVTENTTFLATSTALAGGTPNGAVIINNASNIFVGSVAATGTRVVIRDSTALILGNIIATTSLTATTTAALGDITQDLGTTIGSSTYTTGPAAFAVANGRNITVGNSGNYFGSTVSFAALSGTLANVTIGDTGDLTLPSLSTAGNLTATVDNGTMTLANFTTSAGSATYTGTTSLAAATTITTTTGTTFNGTLNGAQNLTLNAGAGNVNFGSAVGGTTRLGTITIGSAGTITANAITAASLQIPALANATTLTFNGAQNYNTAAGLNAVANIINLSSSVTTTEGGIVSLNADTGALTITSAGDIVSAGVVTLTGAVDISTAGDITTSGAAVIFNNAVAQTGAVTIDTTNSGSSAAGASVTFGGAVTGNQSLTLRVGTANDITIPGGSNLGTLSVVSANNVGVNDTGGLSLGASTISGNLTLTTVGSVTGSGAVIVAGNTQINAGANAITLNNAGNTFTGTVKVNSDVSTLTLVDTTALQLDTISGATLASAGAINITANGITQAVALNIGGTATFNAGSGALVLINSSNIYGGDITVNGGSAQLFVGAGDQLDLKNGSVTTSGLFELTTGGGVSFGLLGGAGGFTLSQADLAKFNVGTFNPVATGVGGITVGAGDWNVPSIGNLTLTTTGTGNIVVTGARFITGNLSMVASGSGTITGAASQVHLVRGLGPIQIGALAGNFSFQNGQNLNLNGTVTIPGRLSLEVAGQFYNQTGQSQPLGGVAGGSVIKSLSLMGGLPNQVSGLAGFSYRYDGQMPTSGNVMSYAVSPLTMFAPGGTTIAGVDLGGTQTGGGQFNTFLTGSDNLNWMISDFGRFDMPTVKPSGMDYILYPQRVEPETRTLPAATLGQLERELGRPPTLDEIQAREVAVREAAIVRSGAILERTSFDAIEDEVDKQESAEVPAQVIDGGKPQAGGGPSVAPNPLSGGAMEGLGVGPQASKTQSVRQGSNGPILRSGPIRSVAQLRPAEPSQSGNISEASAQALKLDAKSVIEQERASAEVGIAPPIAAGR